MVIVKRRGIATRAFVLVPLAELDADLMIPGNGSVRDLLAGVDTSGCEAIGPGNG